jgi:leucine dehydrogenase
MEDKTIFTLEDYDEHEKVVLVGDKKTGLEAMIAIHNTHRGPAIGGCRMFPYSETIDALKDALRLSRGMTYKNAMAGIPFGGGKAVIIADPKSLSEKQRYDILAAFGRRVQELRGEYYTAIDVGINLTDINHIALYTDYTVGTDNQVARHTALGGYYSLKAVIEHLDQTDSFVGKTFAIQGLGQVGLSLAKMLLNAGASLIVTDVDSAAVNRVYEHNRTELARTGSVTYVTPDKIYDAVADVFVPCAMGAILTPRTIARLKVRAVCGLANNQLENKDTGQFFDSQFRKILYAPDYIVNAGGIIYASDQITKKNNVDEKMSGIADTLKAVWAEAEKTNTPASLVADKLARTKIYG